MHIADTEEEDLFLTSIIAGKNRETCRNSSIFVERLYHAHATVHRPRYILEAIFWPSFGNGDIMCPCLPKGLDFSW